MHSCRVLFEAGGPFWIWNRFACVFKTGPKAVGPLGHFTPNPCDGPPEPAPSLSAAARLAAAPHPPKRKRVL